MKPKSLSFAYTDADPPGPFTWNGLGRLRKLTWVSFMGLLSCDLNLNWTAGTSRILIHAVYWLRRCPFRFKILRGTPAFLFGPAPVPCGYTGSMPFGIPSFTLIGYTRLCTTYFSDELVVYYFFNSENYISDFRTAGVINRSGRTIIMLITPLLPSFWIRIRLN